MKTIKLEYTPKKDRRIGIILFCIVWFSLWLGVGRTLQTVDSLSHPRQVEAKEIDIREVLVTTAPQIELQPLKYTEPIIDELYVSDIEKIRKYLVAYGSPRPDLASLIVTTSYKNGVDPYIITAINCQESSCFKACSQGNCSGYGITDSGRVGKTGFDSTEQGLVHMIEKYSTDWNGYYAKCGTDVKCISYKYNNRHSWRANVGIFYNGLTK